MSDLMRINSNLICILESMRNHFLTEEINEINHFIEHREFGIAFQDICWLIIEKNIVVKKHIFILIQELFDMMDGDNDDSWKEIKLKNHIESMKRE